MTPLSLLEKQVRSAGLTSKRFEKWLIEGRSRAIDLFQGIERSVERVWNDTLELVTTLEDAEKRENDLLFRSLLEPIISTPEYQLKEKRVILNDNLNSLKREPSEQELTSLSTLLFLISVQDLTSKKEALKPFWTQPYKELSERLSSHIETDCVGSDTNCSSISSLKGVERSELLKTIYPPKILNEWESDILKERESFDPLKPNKKFKVLKIRIRPTDGTKKLLDQHFDTTCYVYNKTIACINNKEGCSFGPLRDKLVTVETKKNHPEYIPKTKENKKDQNKHLPSTTNLDIRDFEIQTPKVIRSYAVKEAVTAYDICLKNLRNGNIKFFSLGYKEKNEKGCDTRYKSKCITIPHKSITTDIPNIKVFEDPNNKIKRVIGEINVFKRGNQMTFSFWCYKQYGGFKITHDSKVVKNKRNEYFLLVPVDVIPPFSVTPTTFVGVDPGVRTFMTTYGTDGCQEYYPRNSSLRMKLDKVNKRLDINKRLRLKNKRRTLNRLDRKRENIINEVHWKTINGLLKSDVVYCGDIKTHGMVKGKKNRRLNRDINDLKFFLFKQRLSYKALLKSKKVFMTNEAYSSKTCSCCGWQNTELGSSKTFDCGRCSLIIDRDTNASKNILMFGIMSHDKRRTK
jgi:IS605 OrfB family transposase